MNDRPPSRFATYSGDVRTILGDPPKGPTYFGEFVYPVTADYDPATDKTRVGFTYLAPTPEGLRP